MLLDNFPIAIGNRNLEYTLGQISSNGSSMLFGLLSSVTDAHPHEHGRRLFGAKKTGEPIPLIEERRKQFSPTRKNFPFLQIIPARPALPPDTTAAK